MEEGAISSSTASFQSLNIRSRFNSSCGVEQRSCKQEQSRSKEEDQHQVWSRFQQEDAQKQSIRIAAATTAPRELCVSQSRWKRRRGISQPISDNQPGKCFKHQRPTGSHQHNHLRFLPKTGSRPIDRIDVRHSSSAHRRWHNPRRSHLPNQRGTPNKKDNKRNIQKLEQIRQEAVSKGRLRFVQLTVVRPIQGKFTDRQAISTHGQQQGPCDSRLC